MIPKRGFTQSEFEQRLENAQGQMGKNSFDVLLFCTETEVRYFSGFHTQFWQSPTRPWFLCVPKSGKPVAVIPQIGEACMGRTWLDDIRVWNSPNPDDDGISLLEETLRELAGSGTRIGFPMGAETQLRMPLKDFKKLSIDLGGFEFRDTTELIRSLRMVKSEQEIEKIAHVCKLVSQVFKALPEWLLEEPREIDVFHRFKSECLREGVDDVSYLVGEAGPSGYWDIISPPTDRKLKRNDVLILDTGCVFDGYFCDFDRNYAIGKTNESVKKAYRSVYQATDAGFQAAITGNTCAEVFKAMHQVLEKCGTLGNQVGRMGHGLGMQLTEWPSLAPFDQTVLEPGMVITLEPGMSYAPGKLMVHEENIVIREDGPEWLTCRAPPEIPVVDL